MKEGLTFNQASLEQILKFSIEKFLHGGVKTEKSRLD